MFKLHVCLVCFDYTKSCIVSLLNINDINETTNPKKGERETISSISTCNSLSLCSWSLYVYCTMWFFYTYFCYIQTSNTTCYFIRNIHVGMLVWMTEICISVFLLNLIRRYLSVVFTELTIVLGYVTLWCTSEPFGTCFIRSRYLSIRTMLILHEFY